MSKAQPWHLRPAAARTKDGSSIPQKVKHELISNTIALLMSSRNIAAGGSMQWFVPIICFCGKVSPASGLVFAREGLESALSGKQDACAFSLDELLTTSADVSWLGVSPGRFCYFYAVCSCLFRVV